MMTKLVGKVKTFFRTFWRSLTEPAYYQDVFRAKFSFSFKYLTSLFFLTSLVTGLGLGLRLVRLIPQTPNFVQTAKKAIVTTYPAELILTLKDGKIFSNVDEPYFIELPTQAGVPTSGLKHFLEVDTQGGVADFTKLESAFVLTADSIVAADSAGSYKVMPLNEVLKKVPNGTSLTKTSIEALLTGAEPYLVKVLPKILLALTLAAVFVYPPLRTGWYLVGSLIVLAPFSLVLFILAKLVKRQITFVKVYQLTMHGLTIPVLVAFVFSGFAFYSWVFLGAWIVFFIFLIKVILNH